MKPPPLPDDPKQDLKIAVEVAKHLAEENDQLHARLRKAAENIRDLRRRPRT